MLPARVASLTRFGYYLEQALHDALHEESSDSSVVHFWDDDALHIPTFGFERLRPRGEYQPTADDGGVTPPHEYTTQDDLVTQAMFAAGFVGRVSMLAPHRVEYFRQITQRAEDHVTSSYRDRLDQFLAERSPELDSYDSAVRRLEQLAQRGGPEDVALAVRILRDVDPWTFVVMETTANPWPHRLRRLLDREHLIDLTVPGLPTSEETLASEHYSNIFKGLQRMGGAHRSVATAIDAAALSSLVIMVARSTASKQGPFPRFYTSSRRLRKLYYRERWFRDLLSFPIASDSGRVHSGTAWREAYYYQLRTRFPALRPLHSAGRRDVGLSLNQIAILSQEINSAIVKGAAEMDSLLREYRLPDEQSLLQVVHSLESLGMADIWLGRRPEDYFEYWSGGLRAIRQLSSLEETQTHLRREFVEVAQDARLRFALYAAQIDVMVAVARSLQQVENEFGRNPGTAVKNLGLERWGIALSQEEGAALFGADASVGLAWLYEQADVEKLTQEPHRLEIIVGILLSIDEFNLALKLLSLAPESSTAPLSVMRFATQVRDRAFMRDEDLLPLFEELRGFWAAQQQDQEECSRLALGVGYVAFHIWQKTSAAIRIDRPEDPYGIALFALEVVSSRLESFSRDRLILAINHVVYVESVCGMASSTSDQLAAILREQARATGHYRFFDTLGWREYLEVVRGKGSLPECTRLSRAVEDLKTALDRLYRDREVEDHLSVVSEAFSNRCTDEDAATSPKLPSIRDSGTQRSGKWTRPGGA